jgi:hypothetical protein
VRRATARLKTFLVNHPGRLKWSPAELSTVSPGPYSPTARKAS